MTTLLKSLSQWARPVNDWPLADHLPYGPRIDDMTILLHDPIRCCHNRVPQQVELGPFYQLSPRHIETMAEDDLANLAHPLLTLIHQLPECGMLRVWARDCVAPAYEMLVSQAIPLTGSESLPFSGTKLGDELSSLTTPEGVNCEALGQKIVASAVAELSQAETPSRGALLPISKEAFDLSPTDVARFLVMREVQTQLFPLGQASIPSLKQRYHK